MAPISPHLDQHTPPTSTRLSRAAAGRKFIAAPDCCGQILIKCCFAAICLIGHRRDVWSTCRLCLRLPGSHMLSAPCAWPLLAVTTGNGTLGKRGIEEEERPKEAAGLEKAGRSPPPAAHPMLSQVLSPSHRPRDPDQPGCLNSNPPTSFLPWWLRQ